MLRIKVGARASKLSLKQVEEIERGLRYHHPEARFAILCCDSKGDKDQKTSLRDLEKTNFFTEEIDEWVLQGKCRVGIHSAKDLPDPMPQGLEIAAITAPLNTEDVIVFHSKIDPQNPPDNCVIATSSKNREQNVLKELPNAQIVDLRGTIEKRLDQVFEGQVDGVVIAKVALIRLGYSGLNERVLKGKSTPSQGSLAVVCQKDDDEMKVLFSAIDSRQNKKSLYFGLNKSLYYTNGFVDHLPLIEIQPTEESHLLDLNKQIKMASHLLVTSQTTVDLLLNHFKISKDILAQKKIIAVGQATAELLQKQNLYACYIASNESQEGLIDLIKGIPWRSTDSLVYPKSKSARPKLLDFLFNCGVQFYSFDLYDSKPILLKEKPDLSQYDELVFTSSSTAHSFFLNFKDIPPGIKVVCKGEVTQKWIESKRKLSIS